MSAIPKPKEKCSLPFLVADNDLEVRIPSWVADLGAFRRWADSEDCPEKARVHFLHGQIWVDMSREQIFTHNQVKKEFTFVLEGLIRAGNLGYYLVDGARLSNMAADISTLPDGCFISYEAVRSLRVRLPGAREGYVEVEGAPDMVLEVVSSHWVRKDTEVMFQLYGDAGIPEYWLVDVRGKEPRFDIFRHTGKGYLAVRKQAGWLRTQVFDKSFRLLRATDPLGHPQFRLKAK